jgi:hypothetical protein
MSRKKKTDLRKIEEQLDMEILMLTSAIESKMVEKANVREDKPFENKVGLYIYEYLKVLDLITELFKSNFRKNVGIDVPSFIKEWAKKIVEGKDIEEVASEVKEMVEKGISKRKTTKKTREEPDYISFTSFAADNKWKRF